MRMKDLLLSKQSIDGNNTRNYLRNRRMLTTENRTNETRNYLRNRRMLRTENGAKNTRNFLLPRNRRMLRRAKSFLLPRNRRMLRTENGVNLQQPHGPRKRICAIYVRKYLPANKD